MQLDGSARIRGRACIDAGILQLGVVDHQLADVGDHNVPMHVIGFQDYFSLPVHLLLPGDLWLRAASDFAKEAGGVSDEHGLL